MSGQENLPKFLVRGGCSKATINVPMEIYFDGVEWGEGRNLAKILFFGGWEGLLSHDWEPSQKVIPVLKRGFPILKWGGRHPHIKMGNPSFKTGTEVNWGLTYIILLPLF